MRNARLYTTFLVGAALWAQTATVFKSGVRLVEVDAVVRDKAGVVAGLTKDDFALFDCASDRRDCKGKRQRLDVFREVNALAMAANAPVIRLPEGTVSNRLRASGEPVSSATVVLIDQLHTPFELKGYERKEITEFLKSIGDHNRIALYSLGEKLHILQDFTDDPKKLMDAVAKLDSGDQVGVARDDGSSGRIGGVEAQVVAAWKEGITYDALQAIVRHMAGVSGRKNLVWISQGFPLGPPRAGTARSLLGETNISLYPVMIRSLMGSANIAGTRGARPSPGGAALFVQEGIRELGEALGGEGFDDATQALKAVSAAEEDSKNYYVLGFYPADADLDGAVHQLTLELAKSVAKGRSLTLQYRKQYLAAKPGQRVAEEKPTAADLLMSPLDATEIGLTALVEADPMRPGQRLVRASIDLRDANLQRDGDRWKGSLKVSARLESSGANKAPWTFNRTLDISLSDAELDARRGTGLAIAFGLPQGVEAGSARIVVQDGATGAAGSLKVEIKPLP